jgi:Spy/CpxP family protein refolding chaperone
MPTRQNLVTIFTVALLSIGSAHSMGNRPEDCKAEKECTKKDDNKVRGAKHLKEKLGLTDEQMEKFKALRIGAEKDFEVERNALKQERKTLEELKTAGAFTREKIKESLTRLGEIQQKIHAARMKNASDAIDILTDEQLIKAVDSKMMAPFFAPGGELGSLRNHKK